MSRAAAVVAILLSAGGITAPAATANTCAATVLLPTTPLSPDPQVLSLTVTAAPDCEWRLRTSIPSVVASASKGTGPAAVSLWVGANDAFTARTFSVYVNDRVEATLTQQASLDTDRDTLPDSWERQFGFTVTTTPQWGDEYNDFDHDGVYARDEWKEGTHPQARKEDALYFAEGVNGALTTTLALANFEASPAHVLITLSGPTGALRRIPLVVPPLLPRVVDLDQFFPGESAEFAITVETDTPVVAERTTRWPGGGAHSDRGLTWAEVRNTSTSGPGTEWYVAEGTTRAGVNLFYLVHNFSTDVASVQVDYLRPQLPMVTRTYQVPPSSRLTIWVNQESPEFASHEISARVRSSKAVVVDYAFYRPSTNGRFAFASGHAIGLTGRVSWFAEGSTGPFFDTFLALLNTEEHELTATVQYLVDGGDPVTRSYVVPALSRATVWVDQDGALRDRAFGIYILAPGRLVAQRTMWWPYDAASWYEAHTSGPGTAAREALTAAGSLRDGDDTYFLVASLHRVPVSFDVTLYAESGFSTKRTLVVPASSRLSVSVGSLFPEVKGQRFAARLQVVPGSPGGLFFERSMYRTVDGLAWAEGSSAALTAK